MNRSYYMEQEKLCEKITSISLPIGDTNVWFWGHGRFLMGFYIFKWDILF